MLRFLKHLDENSFADGQKLIVVMDATEVTCVFSVSLTSSWANFLVGCLRSEAALR